jgi:Flp pilus assembly protein TadD
MTDSAEQLYKRALAEMKRDQWLAAIALLKRKLPIVQNDWRFSWNLGWCYFKLDKFDDARKQMIRPQGLPQKTPLVSGGWERSISSRSISRRRKSFLQNRSESKSRT